MAAPCRRREALEIQRKRVQVGARAGVGACARACAGARLVAGLAFVAVQGGCDFGTPNRTLPSPSLQCFRFQDPYAAGGTWYRANLHMHTTHSDGAQRPQEMVDLYARNGYGLLSFSDHNQYGDQDGGVLSRYQVDDVLHDWNGDGVLHPEHVFGSGVEAYVRDYGAPPPAWSHDNWYLPRLQPPDIIPVVLLGAETSLIGWHFGLVGVPPGPMERPGGGTGWIARTHEAGGFVFLAHPGEWNDSPDRLAELLPIAAYDGIEILNGLRLAQSGLRKADPGSADDCAAGFPADATPLWDGLLARGYRLWGLANDDAHTWEGAADAPPFTAFDMVLTVDPTPEGFLAALHSGSFYASNGLLFAALGAAGNQVVASAPGATRIRFIGWGGRVLLELDGESGTYTATGDEGYVRVEAVGDAVPGRSWSAQAWSQPFYLEPATCSGGNRRDTRN